MESENEIKQFIAEIKETNITSKANFNLSDKDGLCVVFDFHITEEERDAELSLIEDAYYKHFGQNLKTPKYTQIIDKSVKYHSYNYFFRQEQ